MFSFIRNCKNFYQSGFTNLHSHDKMYETSGDFPSSPAFQVVFQALIYITMNLSKTGQFSIPFSNLKNQFFLEKRLIFKTESGKVPDEPKASCSANSKEML